MIKCCSVFIFIVFVNYILCAPQTATEESADSKTLHLLLPQNQKNNPKCSGAKDEEGTCIDFEECILPELKEDYVKYKKYFCIRSNGKEVGVCCPNGLENRNKRQTTISPPAIHINEVNNEVEGSVDYTKLGDFQDCGYGSQDISSIVRGRAALRDWPWMVVIIRKEDMFHYCGGALITTKHVLSAAHCVVRTKPDEIIARLGEYDFTKADESRSVDMIIQEIISHEDYDHSTYENDIAIFLLKNTAKYNTYVQPICLPLPGPIIQNTTGIVAGWGTIEYGGSMSDVLLQVAVPVWEQEQCVNSFTQTVFETSMCAGGYDGGKDSCQGDSGGPLMTQREDKRWITIGVVSWGVKCGEKGKPGVYTRVNNYLDWIASKIS